MKKILISIFALLLSGCVGYVRTAYDVPVDPTVYDYSLYDSSYWNYYGPDVIVTFRDCYHCRYHGGHWYHQDGHGYYHRH